MKTVYRSTLTLLVALLCLAGCSKPTTPADDFLMVIGKQGLTSGNFDRPRGLRVDAVNDLIYVLDWSGRVQKFTGAGKFRASWRMPAVKNGKAEDFVLNPAGHLMIVDTHYSRVVEFDIDGKELRSWGGYGREPGQFIYPVGIAMDKAGNYYVSEYGENDRIQVFSPDGTLLRSWGSFGSEPGQFQRPSGICISDDDQLFVADGVNHRVQVFDLQGNLIRVIGEHGSGPGQFSYPYDVGVRGDTLYVLEYGNQRVQKLTFDGTPIATYGGGETSPFLSPWRFEVTADAVFVSDTQNNRVVKIDF